MKPSARKTYEQFRRALQGAGYSLHTAVQYTDQVRGLMNKPRDPRDLPSNQETYAHVFKLFSRWVEGQSIPVPRHVFPNPKKNRVPAREVVREMKRRWTC